MRTLSADSKPPHSTPQSLIDAPMLSALNVRLFVVTITSQADVPTFGYRGSHLHSHINVPQGLPTVSLALVLLYLHLLLRSTGPAAPSISPTSQLVMLGSIAWPRGNCNIQQSNYRLRSGPQAIRQATCPPFRWWISFCAKICNFRINCR
jgi:hypothetical protein